MSNMLDELNKACADLKKKQGVPKGVASTKHERCVKDVKKKGHDKSSAYAICNASMKKAAQELVDIKKALFSSEMDLKSAATPKDEKTKADVCYRIEDNIRMLMHLKELRWTVEEDAPEAKKALEDKYKKIQKDIEKLAKEYKSLKKSLGGESMKKSREELVEEFTKKVQDGEMTVEEVEKALKAGYDTATPESHGDNVENIEANKQSTGDSKVAADASNEDGDEGDSKDNAKFADDLFQPVALGSTLRQGSTGNVMSNVKKPSMDYQEVYKNSIKQVTVKKPS